MHVGLLRAAPRSRLLRNVCMASFRPPSRGEAAFCRLSNGTVSNTKLLQTYPLKLLVPQFASSTDCSKWLYMITFGGGIVEGDDISLQVEVGEDCTVVLTTPASTKVYNSESGLTSRQTIRASVDDRGLVAILPDPLVCYRDSIYQQQQVINLTSSSNAILLDWITAGRIALGEIWQMTSCESHNKILIDGKLVYGDAIRLRQDPLNSLQNSMGNALVIGTCAFIGPYFKDSKHELQCKVKELSNQSKEEPGLELVACASILEEPLCDGIVVKLLVGKSTEQAYSFFRTLIQEFVPRLGGDPLAKQ